MCHGHEDVMRWRLAVYLLMVLRPNLELREAISIVAGNPWRILDQVCERLRELRAS